MANDGDYSDQISISDLMAVLKEMPTTDGKVVLRFNPQPTGPLDDEVLVATSVSGMVGIGEDSQLIIYVELHNPDGQGPLVQRQ